MIPHAKTIANSKGANALSNLLTYDQSKVPSDASKFLAAHFFLRNLKKYSKNLTRQQMSTLRGQALAGDVEGADKGLRKLLNQMGD